MANQAGNALLGRFQKALTSAESLHARYTVQPVGGAPSHYTVSLMKPNKAAVDGPSRTIIADGTTITVFDKSRKEYAKRPQTEAELAEVFKPEELNLWSGFFMADAYRPVSTKERGEVTVGSFKLNAVEALYDVHGSRTVVYYLDPQSNVARQARVDTSDVNGRTTSIISTDVLTLGSVPENAFAFSAPAGSKQVTWEAMNALRWLTDLEEALRQAKATGKKVFVDFMTERSTQWKNFDREVLQKNEFRKYAKQAVLLRIDYDKQRHVAATYQVTSLPTAMVLDYKGQIIDSKVGYTGAADFYRFLDAALRP
jgi:outer membrane lipoprotein-sorting protein